MNEDQIRFKQHLSECRLGPTLLFDEQTGSCRYDYADHFVCQVFITSARITISSKLLDVKEDEDPQIIPLLMMQVDKELQYGRLNHQQSSSPNNKSELRFEADLPKSILHPDALEEFEDCYEEFGKHLYETRKRAISLRIEFIRKQVEKRRNERLHGGFSKKKKKVLLLKNKAEGGTHQQPVVKNIPVGKKVSSSVQNVKNCLSLFACYKPGTLVADVPAPPEKKKKKKRRSST